MNFLNKLERKIGRYAISNLPIYILLTYAAGYLMQMVAGDNLLDAISLNPYAIVHGQVWRIVSWVLIPPRSDNVFFVLISLFFYYSISRSLENAWGSFIFNLYVFMGLIFTVLGAFLLLGYFQLIAPQDIAYYDALYMQHMGAECSSLAGGSWFYASTARLFSTYFVNMSLFLAYAMTYPEARVLLMFFIPVKVKVLGILYFIVLVAQGIEMGILGIFVIGASILNFIIFFILTRSRFKMSPKMRTMRKEFKRQSRDAEFIRTTVAKHKCAICGRTSDDYPDLEFRFCSQCEGNYEFCEDHLFTHKHFKRNNTGSES